jgi:hypothetical protein
MVIGDFVPCGAGAGMFRCPHGGLVNNTITSQEAKYLKHAGKLIDVKVSFIIRDGKPVAHVQDYEFYTFASVLSFLRFASLMTCAPVELAAAI